ncbi:MAG: aminotransferase class V-fold PLP-dependent enzyme [Microgenomates group bacterium]
MSFKLDISKEPEAVKNLGTFTTVKPLKVVKPYLESYLVKNLIDAKAYNLVNRCEEEIRSFAKKVFGNKKGEVVLTSGSTEAILLALYYAREENKNISSPNIIVGENAHSSFYRCAEFLRIKIKRARLNSEFGISAEDVARKIDKNTILVVGTMGSTELGVIDDFSTLDKICLEKRKKLHIDAAIGGFIIPFLKTNIKYKFNHLKSLWSVNISGHKYGLSLPGCGLLLLREKNLCEKYREILTYTSSGHSLISGLLVTRSSLGVLSLGLNISYLDFQGYAILAKDYLRIRKKLEDYLKEKEIDFLTGSDFIPQIFVCPHWIRHLSSYLWKNGWIQSVYQPAGLNKEGIRIVIKKGQEKFLLNHLISEIERFLRRTRKK